MKNPLQDSIDKLDLQATIVLLNILSNRALELHLEKAKKENISKLLKPDTAIRLPN